MEIRSSVNLGPRVQVHFEGEGRTKQSMREETNINLIIARYVKTGLVEHLAKHGPEYGFASALSFHECMNVVAKAQSMFADLPASVRRRFDEEPAEFLEFVQNPENQEEMITLGLAKRVPEAEPEVVVEPVEEISAPITPEVPPEVVVEAAAAAGGLEDA